MKTILNFLKANWIVLIICFVFGGLLGHCSTQNKKAEKVITESQLSTALLNQKNALTDKFHSEIIDSSEVIKAYRRRLSDALKPKIAKQRDIVKPLVEIAHNQNNSACDSALNEQEQLIFDLDLKAYNDSIQLAECEKQNNEKSRWLKDKDDAIFGLNNNIPLLSSSLKKYSKEKVLTPYITGSWNTFGYFGVGGGIYFHAVGVGVKYITDTKNKGVEGSLSIKF